MVQDHYRAIMQFSIPKDINAFEKAPLHKTADWFCIKVSCFIVHYSGKYWFYLRSVELRILKGGTTALNVTLQEQSLKKAAVEATKRVLTLRKVREFVSFVRRFYLQVCYSYYVTKFGRLDYRRLSYDSIEQRNSRLSKIYFCSVHW